ncbi:MAG: Hsp20/alpha crystallin family protein [Chloroflexi bacterium]|nr:Hsp20/alpha crystallin family protein [Chloroflexota bacterium]MCY3583229.1 Hsp20/alpha crystallin family protein [Chloroflexota bacterium]MCY3717329.1 Hsp20/alpha crystallin family protein [Chloroflexota bacterium]MDE2651283.1 Hsp20/alpha crystallin family protein [Chloroflexota bacterium]MYA93749.1 Hsp20/alpha crystallin family protein [Chloroflexota bacterium]
MLYRTRNPYFRMVDRLLHDARPVLGNRSEFANLPIGLALDVEESAAGYLLRANLPGVKLDDIKVSIHEDVLTISGETASEPQSEDSKWLIRERRAGKFSRSLRFPGIVDGDAVSASLEDGVLLINLPKAEAHTPRQIPVNVTGSAG